MLKRGLELASDAYDLYNLAQDSQLTPSRALRYWSFKRRKQAEEAKSKSMSRLKMGWRPTRSRALTFRRRSRTPYRRTLRKSSSARSRVSSRFAKRSTKFRQFRQSRRRMIRKPRVPGWARGSFGRYLTKKTCVSDLGAWNMNSVGDNKQNFQSYYMTWAALADNLDEWFKNAFGADDMNQVLRNWEMYIDSIRKVLTLQNNYSMPAVVDFWIVTPKMSQLVNANSADIAGLSPGLISNQTPTESKTTTFAFDQVGHEPWMSGLFTDCFRMKKLKTVHLDPGQSTKIVVAGKGGLFSKAKYGVTEAGKFLDDHMIMRGLSRYGVLIRVRGKLVHDEDTVPAIGTAEYNVSHHVAYSSYNLDCAWRRTVRYRVPLMQDSLAGLTYTGRDFNGVSLMTQAHESRWGTSVTEAKAEL